MVNECRGFVVVICVFILYNSFADLVLSTCVH